MDNMDIIKIIYEQSKSTSPVVIQFGKVVNTTVQHDCIIIKKCPPAIISKLVEAGCWLSVDESGAEIVLS